MSFAALLAAGPYIDIESFTPIRTTNMNEADKTEMLTKVAKYNQLSERVNHLTGSIRALKGTCDSELIKREVKVDIEAKHPEVRLVCHLYGSAELTNHEVRDALLPLLEAKLVEAETNLKNL